MFKFPRGNLIEAYLVDSNAFFHLSFIRSIKARRLGPLSSCWHIQFFAVRNATHCSHVIDRNCGVDIVWSWKVQCLYYCQKSGSNYVNGASELLLPNVNSFEYFKWLGGDHPFTWICLHCLSSNNRWWIHSGIASYWIVKWKTRFTPARSFEHRCGLDNQSSKSIAR